MSEFKNIKCLVWDLDNTLWDGTLLEGGGKILRPGVKETILELDRRGILLSIASKNNYEEAITKLNDFGIADYFLVPQISWGNKSDSIAEIAKLLNLGLDSFGFIDDQKFEREEVTFSHPDVRTYDSSEVQKLTSMDEFKPRFITADSANRRKMYSEDLKRNDSEKEFTGSGNAFLKTLDMKLKLSAVAQGDLERVEELTQRTNQLNSTGVTYSYEELLEFINSPDHVFMIAELEDKFGSYGKIGLLLCEKTESTLTIKLLLMSCRVMTRGIGTALLVYAIKLAEKEHLELQADFISTPRNRIMYITYKLMGFDDQGNNGDRLCLKYSGGEKEYPDYLVMNIN